MRKEVEQQFHITNPDHGNHPEQQGGFITISEASKLTGYNVHWIFKLAQAGRIPARVEEFEERVAFTRKRKKTVVGIEALREWLAKHGGDPEVE